MRGLECALAVLQFRARHHRDPKTLDELAPEFLSDVPKGVFHAQPLKIAFSPNGFKNIATWYAGAKYYQGKPVTGIYALGPNGKDDEGNNDGSLDEKNPDDTLVLIHPILPHNA